MKKDKNRVDTSTDIEYPKVLVVEDDRSHRVLIDKILQNAGFKTELVKNGVDALEYLQSGKRYDLILMDWDMPRLNGLDTTRAIRALEAVEDCKPTAILAFTASRKTGDREQCLAAGMDAYLPKDVWMPKWHHILTDTLRGLIEGDFTIEDLDTLAGPERNHIETPSGEFDYVLDDFDEKAYLQAEDLFKSEMAIAVHEFLEDGGIYISRIRSGLLSQDLEMMAKASHPLKSNSKSFGLLSVSKLAEAINVLCEQTDNREVAVKTCGLLLPKLEEAFLYGTQTLKSKACCERPKVQGVL